MILWSLIAFAAATYCLVRGIVDLRQGKYIWGTLGVLSAVVLMLTPLQTHAVKIDLPAPAHR